MIVSAALATLLCCAALGAGDGAGRLVLKCCAEDEVIDVAEEKCLQEPNEAVNGSRSPFWLPEWLRAEPGLEVEFHGIGWLYHWKREGHGASVPRAWLGAEEPLGRRLLAVDADARRFVLEPFGHVDVRTVAGQQMCFDVTLDPRRPFVVATWLHSVALNKCCGKGARLDGRLQCRPPAVPRRPDRFPDMDFLRPLNSTPWAPGHLREAVPAVDVYYDMLRELPGAEGTLVDADDPSAWKLLFPRPHEQWGEAVWVRTDGGVEGAGTFFCLDATEAGSGLPARVLLARVALVSKCCRRGQQLEPRAMECRVRSQTEVDARPQELLAPGDPSAYWLPRALAAAGRAVPVWYRDNWDERPLRLVFPAERARVTRFPDRPPVACVTLRRPSGREYEACAGDFCFEALAGGPGQRVFAVDRFDGIEVVAVHKCCHQGQMLHVERGALGSSKIRCHPDAAEDWSPENSSLADELHPERLYVGQPLQECLAQALTLVDEEPEREMEKLVGVGFEGHFAVRFYCKDLLRDGDGDGGSVRDVLAFCEMPPNAELFRKVRLELAVRLKILAG
ncbi:hypothetical protein R5R35_012311 [Gryllus longicercus]|uniref:Uncharacterized protein n=1 Tax=Gryllus longicercus TaxID=2509291 RepID=A0AAN9V9F2_9ORTH